MEFNTLSWLIYSAEVIGGLSSTLAFVFIMLCIGIMAVSILWVMQTFSDDSEDEDTKARAAKAAGINKRLFVILVIVCFVGLFVPSTRTIYLIAASEMGEQVLNTDTAVKLKKIIDYKLDEIIKEQEPTQQPAQVQE